MNGRTTASADSADVDGDEETKLLLPNGNCRDERNDGDDDDEAEAAPPLTQSDEGAEAAAPIIAALEEKEVAVRSIVANRTADGTIRRGITRNYVK